MYYKVKVNKTWDSYLQNKELLLEEFIRYHLDKTHSEGDLEVIRENIDNLINSFTFLIEMLFHKKMITENEFRQLVGISGTTSFEIIEYQEEKQKK